MLDKALKEWQSKPRRMGYVSATDWLVKRVQGFYSKRITLYTASGEVYEHVIATNGKVDIDLAPYACKPSDA